MDSSVAATKPGFLASLGMTGCRGGSKIIKPRRNCRCLCHCEGGVGPRNPGLIRPRADSRKEKRKMNLARPQLGTNSLPAGPLHLFLAPAAICATIPATMPKHKTKVRRRPAPKARRKPASGGKLPNQPQQVVAEPLCSVESALPGAVAWAKIVVVIRRWQLSDDPAHSDLPAACRPLDRGRTSG